MENLEIKRGDIVFIENPNKQSRGHVIYGDHPAVVIQNNKGNGYSTNIIVAFITSSMKRLEMPTHIVLQHYEGLRKVSVVHTEQIATIDKGDVISVIDHLTEADMARVDQALKVSLDLTTV